MQILFKNSLIIHKEKTKDIIFMFNECLYIGLTLPQNFLDQNDPKFKYQCKDGLIYIRDFEAIKKTNSCTLSGVNNLSFASSF